MSKQNSRGGSGSRGSGGSRSGSVKKPPRAKNVRKHPPRSVKRATVADGRERGKPQEGSSKGALELTSVAVQSAKAGIDAILEFFALRRGFDAQAEQEAATVAAWDISGEVGERADLRELLAFTIDGADAKDFDDAVSIEPIEGGVRLGVHIADVSWYVQSGTLLDSQAQARATSVYLADRVLPMLPEAISNGCCSLLPDEDRLAISAMIDCGSGGEVLGYRIVRSVIRSKARLVYDDVNLLLQGDAEQVARYATLLPTLQQMAALAAKLRAARFAKGALDFDVDEAAVAVDLEGEPVAILVRPRGVAERMIEDFMLIANQVVAQHAKQKKLPCLYRVHEPMEADKAMALASFVRGLGLRLKGAYSGATQETLQQLLHDAETRPEYPVIAQMMLRAMQRARYDPEPLGHFGLATADYCHFTAPIRRYPDLFVHRMLGAEMSGELRYCERAMRATAPSLAAHTSERERNAMEAERAVEKLMMARYMAKHIGEEFEGLVVSVVEWGFYVELPNTIEGLVPIRTLPGYWTLNRELQCLVGDEQARASTNGVFKLGESVKIRVESVNVGARQIDFALADMPAPNRKKKELPR